MKKHCLLGTYVNKNNKELVELFKRACQEAGISATSKATFESNCKYLEVYSFDMGEEDPYEITSTDRPEPDSTELTIDCIKKMLEESKSQEWDGEDSPPVEWKNGDECQHANGAIFTFIGKCDNPKGFDCVLMDRSGNAVLSSINYLSSPETKQQREERERLEAAYDLYMEYTDGENCYSFPTFCKLTAKNKWLSIVDKTSYRKAK